MTHTRSPFPWRLLAFWLYRTLPLWALTALMIFLVQIAICGIVHDNENVKAFLSLLRLLPGIITTALGGEALQLGNVTGLVAMGYMHPMVLTLYMLFAVAVPTGFLAGQVQQGTMELILSRPTTKTQVYMCAGAVTLLGMVGLAGVMFLGTATGTRLYTFDQPVSLQPFLRAAQMASLAAGTVGAIALLAGAAFHRRGTAVGVTGGFLVVNYAVAVIAPWWPWMQPVTRFSLFYYIDLTPAFLGRPWPVSDLAVLGSVLIVSAVVGGIIWQRRDLPL
jgi:ABC-2 type transport system permease protein